MRTHRGQASVEYVGAILLLALLLASAVAVADPGVTKTVVAKFKLALCIVGGDVCTPADAEARGLEPCVLSTDSHEQDNGVSAWVIHAGGSEFWSVERRSDGTLTLTEGYGQNADVSAGMALRLGPIRKKLQVGNIGAGFRSGQSWVLSQAQLDDFLARTHGRPTWTSPLLLGTATSKFVEGGGSGSASLAGKVGIGKARAVLGRRKDADGTTYYVDLGGDAAKQIAAAVPGLGPTGDVTAEYRTHPATITLRAGDDDTETIFTLRLSDLSDRDVAGRVSFLDDPGLALHDLIDRIKARGTIERRRYRTTTDTHGWDHGLGPFGADHRVTTTSRELVDAEIIGGGRREDCLASSLVAGKTG